VSGPHPARMRVAVPSLLLVLLAETGGALTYVDATTGLDTPTLDTGRTDLALVDVDLDGHVDVVSIGDHGSPHIGSPQHGIMVWFGDGNGDFEVVQVGEFGYGGIAIGDVNGDGLNDAAYGMHHDYSGVDLGDQILEVALGDGTGTSWTPWDDGLATSGEDWGMFGTVLVDVDHDGDLDVGSISFGCCSGVHVYLNQGDGTWIQSWGFLGGNSTQELRTGDVNADGHPDLCAAHQYGSIYLGDGTGDFTLMDAGLPAPGTVGRRGPDLGDVDGDGADDLAFVTADRGVAVYVLGTGSTWQSRSDGLPAAGAYRAARLADLDGDGNVDLLAFDGERIDLWRGDGTGGWTPDDPVIVSASGDYAAFRVADDLDHNGRPDLVVVVEEGTWPSYQNHLRAYLETTPATTLAARVVEPSPGRRLVPGSVAFIRWTAAVPAPATAIVDLDLSISGPDGPWDPVGADLTGGGRHQWTVPEASSADCWIRVTVRAGLETTEAVSGPFGIGVPPTVAVPPTSPGAGLAPVVSLLRNPVVGAIPVRVAVPRGGVHRVALFDVLGREVIARTITLDAGHHELRIDPAAGPGTSTASIAGGWAPGVYLLRVRGPAGVTTTRVSVVDGIR